jgi:malate synthase
VPLFVDGRPKNREVAALVWQWLHHGRFDREHVRAVTDEEIAKLGPGYEQARELFDRLATGDEFIEFLTLPAYQMLD